MLVLGHALGRMSYVGRHTSVLVERLSPDRRLVDLVITTPDVVTHDSEGASAHRDRQGRGPRAGPGREHRVTVMLGAGVFVGDRGRITFLDVRAGLVHLGFTFPREISVSRDVISYEQHLAFQIRREQATPVNSQPVRGGR